MTEVINVRFKNRSKSYFFDPRGLTAHEGDRVVVETQKGLELGECVYGNHYVRDERVVSSLRPVLRLATGEDIRAEEQNLAKEREAFAVGQRKISERKLDMKLVDVELNFEGTKLLFFFTSDGRVDFRDLVKDLASIFHTRIELRQIGVRDEAKMLGGLGICGRPFCCSQFLDDFHPVSTKMAKTQSMSLNPTKISGSCGRLMCCLRYEQDAYEDLVKKIPKVGTFVETPGGFGSVSQAGVLRQTVKVKLDSAGDPVIKAYGVDEIAVVPGGRPKPGEDPVSTLVLKPKEEASEPSAAVKEPPIPALLRPLRPNRPQAPQQPNRPQAPQEQEPAPKRPFDPRKQQKSQKFKTKLQPQPQDPAPAQPKQGGGSGKRNGQRRKYYK